MTTDELKKLSRENLKKSKQGSLCECYDEAFIKGYGLSEKRIAELEKENKVLAQNLEDTEILNKTYEKRFKDLEKENAELRKIAEFQQSSNMNTHLENKKLKEGLAVGSTFNKALNSMNKSLEEERDMVFDLQKENAELKKQLEMSNKVYNDNLDYSYHIEGQLTKAKEIINKMLYVSCNSDVLVQYPNCSKVLQSRVEAEQFLKDCEVEK